MRCALAALAVICATTATASAGKRFKPPARYAALFVAGRQWSYQVTRQVDRYTDDNDIIHDPAETLTVTCSVVEVGSFRGGVTSRIECEPMSDGGEHDVVPGVWVATKRGLFRSHGEMPKDGTAPPRDDLVLVLPARLRAHSDHDELDEGWTESAIRKQGTAWCADDSWGTIMKRASQTLCFDHGIREGGFDDDDENDRRVQATFTRLP